MPADFSSAVVPTLTTESHTVPQISVADLYQRINQPNQLLLLDVRNDEEFDAWRIESRYSPETLHIFYGQIIEDEGLLGRHIPRDREVVVLCAKGGASDFVAETLRRDFGIPAVNVAEGMLGWGNFYTRLPVIECEHYAIYQIARPARGCLSYILISQGQAAILDPLRHTGQYLQFLAEANTKLTWILDTHAHADHISGGPALGQATGAPYHLHPYDAIHPFDMLPARLAYEMLHDGQTFRVGDLLLSAIHTPGHTLGQVNFLATAIDGQAFFFSGDNIFLQSFGRPDLGGQGEAWAPIVYETIFKTVKERVPELALVLPGHFARPEEADQEGLFAKTLGALWNENQDLTITGRQAFIDHVLSHLPEMPQQYIQIKRVNNGLVEPDEEQASELELGKNVCALSTAY